MHIHPVIHTYTHSFVFVCIGTHACPPYSSLFFFYGALQEIAGWQQCDPSNSLTMHLTRMKGIVSACLLTLHGEHRGKYEHLKVTCKPKKAVYVTQAIGQGQLVLVPSSTNIGATVLDHGLNEPKQKDTNAIPLGVLMQNPVSGQNVYFSVSPYTLLPSEKVKGFVNPYFFVRVVEDQDSANMAIETREVKHSVCLNEKKGRKHEETLVIPVLVNVKKVSPGDELVAFKAKPDSKVEPVAGQARPAERPRST